MIARELEEFFGAFSSGADVRMDDADDRADPASGFFSNVNSCVLRECWRQVRFRDVPYAEDQAFARDAMAAGWKKAYVPQAPVVHAHDYPFLQFMRRYFDEYRGLRETAGHVEPRSLARVAPTVRAQVRRDLDYMRRRGDARGPRLVWGARSARHHAGRALFAALGSRAERLPVPVQKRLSLEGRFASGSGRRFDSGAAAAGRAVRATRHPFDYVRAPSGAAQVPLAPASPHDGDKPLMHLAWLIPPFRRGSGGHMTIFTLIRELEGMGHSCSIWIHDPGGLMPRRAALAAREIVEHFVPIRAGVFRGFEDWQGADVALATGWQTAYPLSRLPSCALKAYLVQDYEPDFYPASSERLWAEATYRMGLPCLAASPWLRDLMRERYQGRAQAFELGVDFDTYKRLDLEREPETIVFYARPATPRRATELGLLALAELVERRPQARVVLFGDVTAPPAPFDYEFRGVMDASSLAELYNRATIGLVISLTNYSRMPKEMMACGLPVVDVDHPSVESVFGRSGDLIELAEPEPVALADRISSMLDQPQRRARLAAAAERFVAPMTWRAAAGQIDGHLRGWSRRRWAQTREPETRPSESSPRAEALRLAGGHLT
jgi:glycosyltransferase involved in cell wall biosynthesis